MKNIIHIYGASGSGVTTLGKRFEKELGFKLLDIDDYFWQPTNPPYTTTRPCEERIKLLNKDMQDAENVVMSGSFTEWGDVFIPSLTLALRVITDQQIRIERLKQRERMHFGSRIDENGDMYKAHLEFLEWAKSYDTADTSIRSKAKHDEWQKLLTCKIIEVNGNDISAFDFNTIKQYLLK